MNNQTIDYKGWKITEGGDEDLGGVFFTAIRPGGCYRVDYAPDLRELKDSLDKMPVTKHWEQWNTNGTEGGE